MRKIRFKTVVINIKHVKISAFISGVIILIFCITGILSEGQQLAISDDFYKTVISSGMHGGERKFSPAKIFEKITGIDFKEPKSIIRGYSAVLDGEYEMAKKTVPEKTPEPENAPEERMAEERKVTGNMKISNQTNIEVDANQLAKEPLGFTFEKNKEPQILIMHTHTTESFAGSNNNKYIVTDSDRNLDETKNIVEVGKNMAEVLNSVGINTVHDTTVHDYPSYNGAYTRAYATISKNMSDKQNIKIVLDVHRDGIIRDDGTKVKVACDIGGEKVAQCMFVVGSNANLTHNNWLENMKFACRLQACANEMYPGLMRPIILREERFNQQICTGSLIVEVGSNGNTLEEAIRGGRYMAEVIAKCLS